MKKGNFKSLKLNKSIVSNFKTEKMRGGQSTIPSVCINVFCHLSKDAPCHTEYSDCDCPTGRC